MEKCDSPQSFASLVKKLQNSQGAGIYIFGDSSFMKEKIIEIAQQRVAGPMQAMNKTIFQGNELKSTVPLFDELLQYPSMAQERVVIVRNFNKVAKAVREKIAAFEVPDTSFLVLEEEKPNKNTKVFKTLSKKMLAADLSEPRLYNIKPWADYFARKYSVSMAPNAIEYIVNNAAVSIDSLRSEIEKISIIYKDKRVSQKDIEEIVSHSLSKSRFDFSDAIRARNPRAILSTVENILSFGEKAASLLWTLGEEIRTIAMIRAGQQVRMNPYILRKYESSASRFSEKELRANLITTYRADILVKSGKMKDTDAIFWALGDIISSWNQR